MAPPTPIYTATDLPLQINTLPNGKQRKPPIHDLQGCALKEMVQYKCNISPPKQKGAKSVIICEPVVRMFRVCEGGLHVETTAWEGLDSRQGDVKS